MTTSDVQLFASADGLARLGEALDSDTIWLRQAQMVKLFDKDVRTVGELIKNIYAEKKVQKDPTIRNLRITRHESLCLISLTFRERTSQTNEAPNQF